MHDALPIRETLSAADLAPFGAPGSIHRLLVFLPNTSILLLGVTDAISPQTGLAGVAAWGRMVLDKESPEAVAALVVNYHWTPPGDDRDTDSAPSCRWPLLAILGAYGLLPEEGEDGA